MRKPIPELCFVAMLFSVAKMSKPESRGLHALGQEARVAHERDADEDDEACKEKDQMRLIALQKRPAGNDRDDHCDPWQEC